MLSTTLSSKGQVILPSEIRKKINIQKGTKFIIEINNDRIILTPINKGFFKELAGSISKDGKLLKALTLEKEREKNL